MMIGNVVTSIVTMVVSAILAVGLHEVGHLIAGWLAGCRLVTFRLFGLNIFHEADRWRVSFGGVGAGLLGQCLMVPTVPEDRFRSRLYHAGGFVMNFVLAVLGVLGWLLADSSTLRQVMALWAYVNLIVGLIQAVPWSASLANDGWNLLDDIRSQCQGRDLYRVLTINARLAQGARLRDVDASLFEAPPGGPCGCSMAWFRMISAAERLDDQGDHAGASQAMDAVRQAGVTGYYAAHVLCSILFNHLVYGVDTVPVPDRNDPVLTRFFKMPLPDVLMARAALAHADGDTAQALGLLDQAEQRARSSVTSGELVALHEQMTQLRQRWSTPS